MRKKIVFSQRRFEDGVYSVFIVCEDNSFAIIPLDNLKNWELLTSGGELYLVGSANSYAIQTA